MSERRKNKMIEMHKSGMSYAAIGRQTGLTRQRVRQICNDIDSNKSITYVCEACGNVRTRKGQLTRMCRSCYEGHSKCR